MLENKPQRTSIAESRREILDELTRLREAMSSKARGSISGGSSGLIIARLFTGLTLDEWSDILKEGHLTQWLALPATGDATPHLAMIQRTLEELAHQTRHDSLTGLANRRAFEKNLKLELERAHRSHSSLSLAILDLDDFKAVNDTYGHLCGDRVLTAVAGTLLSHKRGYDMAARIGGEEFALILPGSGLMQAEATLARLLDEARERKVTCESAAETVGVTFSVGIVCTKGKVPLSVERFIDLADKALYEAKAQGKNRIIKAPIPDLLEASQATLVHPREKQFLFTGPD